MEQSTQFNNRIFIPQCPSIESTSSILKDPILHPLGRTRLLSHGKKTATAVLWFHGYSTCPQQFVPLGQKCFEHGMNVYIPRAPSPWDQ